MKTQSTSTLAKELGLSTKEAYEVLRKADYVYKKDEKWILTDKGKSIGGKVISTEQYGEFIVWPMDFNPSESNEEINNELITVTKIAEEFGDISNQRVNNIFEELGWIEKAPKGWKVTTQGRKEGGVQKEYKTGGFYVKWSNTILTNTAFLKSIRPKEAIESESVNEPLASGGYSNERLDNKYPQTLLKATDGHIVKSRGELIIDNLLYDYRLVHAYERELIVAEHTVRSDFYIPANDGRKAVYIEFWGIQDNVNYLDRKKEKQEIYKAHNKNLINIEEKHLDNIDSYLRRAFLEFDINIE